MTTCNLRGALCLVAALVLQTVAATAQTYPDRAIRLIVPFAAGGPTDVFARVVAERTGALLGEKMVIENRGGAGGNIGAEQVASAKPDGYSLLFASAAIAIAPTLCPSLKYDPHKDLEP